MAREELEAARAAEKYMSHLIVSQQQLLEMQAQPHRLGAAIGPWSRPQAAVSRPLAAAEAADRPTVELEARSEQRDARPSTSTSRQTPGLGQPRPLSSPTVTPRDGLEGALTVDVNVKEASMLLRWRPKPGSVRSRIKVRRGGDGAPWVKVGKDLPSRSTNVLRMKQLTVGDYQFGVWGSDGEGNFGAQDEPYSTVKASLRAIDPVSKPSVKVTERSIALQWKHPAAESGKAHTYRVGVRDYLTRQDTDFRVVADELKELQYTVTEGLRPNTMYEVVVFAILDGMESEGSVSFAKTRRDGTDTEKTARQRLHPREGSPARPAQPTPPTSEFLSRTQAAASGDSRSRPPAAFLSQMRQDRGPQMQPPVDFLSQMRQEPAAGFLAQPQSADSIEPTPGAPPPGFLPQQMSTAPASGAGGPPPGFLPQQMPPPLGPEAAGPPRGFLPQQTAPGPVLRSGGPPPGFLPQPMPPLPASGQGGPPPGFLSQQMLPGVSSSAGGEGPPPGFLARAPQNAGPGPGGPPPGFMQPTSQEAAAQDRAPRQPQQGFPDQ